LALALVLKYVGCIKIRIYEKDICCECADPVAVLCYSITDVLMQQKNDPDSCWHGILLTHIG
jgi:hypothetical protein